MYIYIYMYIQSIHSTVHVYRTYTWAEVTKYVALTENDHDFSQSLWVFPRSALATRSCASSDFMSSSSSKFLLFNRSTTLTKTPTKKKHQFKTPISTSKNHPFQQNLLVSKFQMAPWATPWKSWIATHMLSPAIHPCSRIDSWPKT